MEHEIVCKPDFAMAKVRLSQGEELVAEAGAMVAMRGAVTIQTSARGGIVAGLKRSVLGGESFFQNTFTAGAGGGEVYLSPGVPGDLRYMRLDGGPFFLQSGSYVASSKGVTVDTKWAGAKGFFGREGLFMLQCSGQGDLWFSSFGAIHEVGVTGSYVCDTGAIVAFERGLQYRVRSVGGLKSLLFSGEGLVCDFTGSGKLYLQTRMPAAFVSWVNPFRRKKSKS